jgi:hypothetical protein
VGREGVLSCEPALLHAAPFAKIETEVVPTRTKEVVGPTLENSFTTQQIHQESRSGCKTSIAYEIPDSAAVDEGQERRKKHHIGITYTYLLRL